MKPDTDPKGTLRQLLDYVIHLRDSSPYWRYQATAIGVILVVTVLSGVGIAFIGLYSVFGGGSITYAAKGSPGPVTFSHYSHMWFKDGKYKDCKTCHDKLFAAQAYGTYVLRALKDSPPKKYRIGKEATTLFVPEANAATDIQPVTYEVQRACKTCATGTCHDGKESFGRLECLKCHKRR